MPSFVENTCSTCITMHMCTCIYLYKYMNIYLDEYICIYISIYIHTYTHTHTDKHRYIRLYIYTCMYLYLYIYLYIYISMYIYEYTSYTYICICSREHISTHMHARTLSLCTFKCTSQAHLTRPRTYVCVYTRTQTRSRRREKAEETKYKETKNDRQLCADAEVLLPQRKH